MTLQPGVPTEDHWRVGRDHQVLNWTPFPPMVRMGHGNVNRRPHSVGRCISVTPWGSNRIRWVRLRHMDGSEKSYAPSELQVLEPLA